MRTGLAARLQAWKDERESNQYGLAHLADDAIREIEAMLHDDGGERDAD